MTEPAPLVIFDGVCNLCVGSVKFILGHEREPVLHFASLQSATGARLVRELGFDPEDAKTFVLVDGGRAYVRSAAAIHLAYFLRWPWQLLAAVRIIPRPVRDWAYGLVAANRHRLFGRTEACMVPTPQLRARFVQD
jgi:predicted DCC family thiol-disulfide oxidoreductase YuxK